MDSHERTLVIFIVFSILAIVVIFSFLTYIIAVEEPNRCEAVGGNWEPFICFKMVDGHYVRGGAVEINDKLVFVQNG